MKTIIKLIILISVAYGGYQLWGRDFLGKVKSKTIEVIKPSAKRAELLGNLNANLDEIGNNLPNINSTDPQQKPDAVNKISSGIKDSKNIVDNISELNEKDDGVIGEIAANLANKILGKNPTPTMCPVPSK